MELNVCKAGFCQSGQAHIIEECTIWKFNFDRSRFKITIEKYSLVLQELIRFLVKSRLSNFFNDIALYGFVFSWYFFNWCKAAANGPVISCNFPCALIAKLNVANGNNLRRIGSSLNSPDCTKRSGNLADAKSLGYAYVMFDNLK